MQGTPSAEPGSDTVARGKPGFPPLPVPSKPEPAPTQQRVQHVRELQDDLGVLLRHLATTAAAGPALQGGTTQPLGGEETANAAALLVLDPSEIARDKVLLQLLYAALARLSRLSAPADVNSIRLTRAFVEGSNAGAVPAFIGKGARRLRRWTWASAGFGLLVFAMAVLLLVHVDRGRRTVQQLKAVRLEYQTAINNLNLTRVGLGKTAPDAAPVDCQEAQPSDLPAGNIKEPGSWQERALCEQQQSALAQLRLVYRELAIWNATSERLSYISPITWLTADPKLPPSITPVEWASTELRTSVLITAMTGFVMPMLLGVLGACVYVYRELDAALQASTLEAREVLHGTLRLLLGGILGGLLGVLWTNGEVLELEGVSLSLGALAFFVGLSVEVVFRLVDALVRSVSDRIGKLPPARNSA